MRSEDAHNSHSETSPNLKTSERSVPPGEEVAYIPDIYINISCYFSRHAYGSIISCFSDSACMRIKIRRYRPSTLGYLEIYPNCHLRPVHNVQNHKTFFVDVDRLNYRGQVQEL